MPVFQRAEFQSGFILSQLGVETPLSLEYAVKRHCCFQKLVCLVQNGNPVPCFFMTFPQVDWFQMGKPYCSFRRESRNISILLPFYKYVWRALKVQSLEEPECSLQILYGQLSALVTITHKAMRFHWKLMVQLHEDGVTTGYIAKGLWAAEVSSPTLLEDSQRCLSLGRHCQLQPGAAEHIRNAKLVLTKCTWPRSAKLSCWNDCSVPSTYLSLPTEFECKLHSYLH